MAIQKQTIGGSFRDPAGFVFKLDDKVYRQVNKVGQADYDLLMSSGLYKELIDKQLMVAHKEVTTLKLPADSNRYKIIQPTVIPFISYPYEWSFNQLQAAALTTIAVLRTALKHGLILKDASAFNIQFIGQKPVFIDTLSFTTYQTGDAWEGYKQFCEHFVAPLALAHYSSPSSLKLLQTNIDGLPLDLAVRLLPKRARLQRGLLTHLYLHAAAQRRYQKGGDKTASARKPKLSKLALDGLIASLERTIKKLKSPNVSTEWGNYYDFTNYSDAAFKQKRQLVADLLKQVKPAPKVVWDIGANNGEFSEIAAAKGAYTIAFDIDEPAVARNFETKWPAEVTSHLLPLVEDLTNPSPALGWAHDERASLIDRGPADVVFALALIHHLAIGNNLPFPAIATFLRSIGNWIIIEFVPKEDSKVQHLLATRKDIFTEYDNEHFEAAMNQHFRLVAKKPVKGSKRSLYLYKAKA